MSIAVVVFAGIGALVVFAVVACVAWVGFGLLFEHAKTRRLAHAGAGVEAVPQVDAIAELLEAKAAIRVDELRRWGEAWQRAAQLPDFWAAVREIQAVEFVAVREDRERRRTAEEAARRLAVEERITAAAEQRELDRVRFCRERATAEAHAAHLAARRARYAQRRSNA